MGALIEPRGHDAVALDPDDHVRLLRHQAAVMQQIAGGASLAAALTTVARALEDLMPGSRCSILLADRTMTRLRHGAAPSLPEAYSRAIDGIAVGPSAGSCGAAAYQGQEVIAEDVVVDPRWDGFRALAVRHGLRACWSTPILGREGIVGTFAVYHCHPHRPTARERGLVEHFTQLASVAVDHDRLYGALAESEERFRRAFEDNTVGMALTSADGVVVRTNRALLDMLGRSDDEVLGREFARLVPVAGVVEDGVRDAVVTRPDGRPVRLAVTGSTLRDAAGQAAGICLNVVDVTQQWAAARDREAREAAEFGRRVAEEARRSAEEASRAKSAFVSALSHELRTPLQAITGFTELLGGLDLTPERRQAALGHIRGATGHILALVDDVLDLARVEAGALPICLDDVPAARAVRGVLDLLDPLADTRGVGLTAEVEPAVLRADPRRLRQVLLNVVGNAIRYNRAGGRVRVEVAVEGDRVRIRVADDGPGISADLLERLFVPFERLDADAGPERGVGLGLALSRSLTEAMGGRLVLQSRPGVGTVVKVTLPIAAS